MWKALSLTALAMVFASCYGLLPASRTVEGRSVSVGFSSCTHAVAPSGAAQGWNHTINNVIAIGSPRHFGIDAIASLGTEARLEAKFSYGALSKDLEGEHVAVWLSNCEGTNDFLGTAVTDSDGRIELEVAVDDLPSTGEYRVFFHVLGDGSNTESYLRIFPEGTEFVVFDIDATLTTDDSALVGEVINGQPPEAREAAAEVTQMHFDAGYEVLYLTGRPYLWTHSSRSWLANGGFAQGTLRLVQDVANIWPSEDKVGAYKTEVLQSLSDKGFVFRRAYGNATTDIFAYANGGVPLDSTFIIGEKGGEGGTVAIGDYQAHLLDLETLPLADQPFSR